MAGEIVPYRPATQDDRDAIVKPITQGLNELVFGGPGLFNDRPGFIAAPPGGNPLVDAVRGISQYNCRRWAAADKSNFSTRVNAGNAELCGPYLDGIGENPTGGDVGPPFKGGQCYGLTYALTFSAIDATGSRQSTDQQISGRIIGTDVRPNSAQGTQTAGILRQLADGGPIDFIGLITKFANGPSDPQITNVRRVDGGDDNCGDPPIQIQPPATVTPVSPIPPTIVVNLPGFGPVNVSVNLDPDGDPIVCFEEVSVCVTIKPPELGGGGGGSGGGAPPLEPVVGDPIDGPPAGSGGGGSDTPFGPPPEGRIWVGAFVHITNSMALAGIVPGSAPENAALTKVVGNASLIIDNGLIARVRSRATQIRSEWSEHLVAYPGLTVNGIRVNINPSLTYRVYPVSVVNPTLEQGA